MVALCGDSGGAVVGCIHSSLLSCYGEKREKSVYARLCSKCVHSLIDREESLRKLSMYYYKSTQIVMDSDFNTSLLPICTPSYVVYSSFFAFIEEINEPKRIVLKSLSTIKLY